MVDRAPTDKALVTAGEVKQKLLTLDAAPCEERVGADGSIYLYFTNVGAKATLYCDGDGGLAARTEFVSCDGPTTAWDVDASIPIADLQRILDHVNYDEIRRHERENEDWQASEEGCVINDYVLREWIASVQANHRETKRELKNRDQFSPVSATTKSFAASISSLIALVGSQAEDLIRLREEVKRLQKKLNASSGAEI